MIRKSAVLLSPFPRRHTHHADARLLVGDAGVQARQDARLRHFAHVNSQGYVPKVEREDERGQVTEGYQPLDNCVSIQVR